MEFIQKELEQIKKFIEEQSILRKEVLTLDEASLYLGQSKSSIYKLTSKREIPFYSPGGKKIYFKREEIDAWIYQSKMMPTTEVESEINNYLSRTVNI
jgi:excisionase family DNA binding protein